MNRYRLAPGYTLLELTFAIALLTSITMMSLTAFVGIFGVYNKAQSLTRTQQESRNAIDQLTRDLRQTYTLDYYASRTAQNSAPASVQSAASSTNPAASTPSASNMKDFYCLKSKDGSMQVGYALLYRASTSRFNLVRSPKSCSDYSNPEQVVSLDVWSDLGTVPVPANGADGDNSDLDANSRPLKIDYVSGTDPRVWYVRVATFRGAGIPGKNVLDTFGAQTTLDSVVVTRD